MKRIFYIFVLAFLPLAGFGQAVDSFRIRFQHDFELNTIGTYNYNEWNSDWAPHTNDEYEQMYIEQCADGDNSSKVLRIEYSEGDYGLGMGSGVNWYTILPQTYDELYFSYRLKLKEGYDPVLSGKFPAFRGGGTWSGSGPPAVDEGYAMMLAWTYDCNTDTTIYFYAYYHNQESEEYGDAFCPVPSYGLDTMETKWVTVTIRLVLNTFTGATPDTNGILELFADSVCILTQGGFVWRELESIKTDRLWIQYFFGGNSESFAAKRDEWMKMDDPIAWEYGDDVLGMVRDNNQNELGNKIIIPPIDYYSVYSSGRHEHCDDEPDYYGDYITDTDWIGQHITIGANGDNENQKVDSLYWFGRVTTEVGTLTFYIDTVDGDGYPDGVHLYTGSIANSLITQDGGGAGYYITMTGSDSLYKDGHYAPYAVNTHSSAYWFSNSTGTYPGGNQIIYDGTWRTSASYDCVFEIHGTGAIYQPPSDFVKQDNFLKGSKQKIFLKNIQQNIYRKQ